VKIVAKIAMSEMIIRIMTSPGAYRSNDRLNRAQATGQTPLKTDHRKCRPFVRAADRRNPTDCVFQERHATPQGNVFLNSLENQRVSPGFVPVLVVTASLLVRMPVGAHHMCPGFGRGQEQGEHYVTRATWHHHGNNYNREHAQETVRPIRKTE